MIEPKWLSVAMIRAAHAGTIARHGGTAELRDLGLLESALDRPRNVYAYGADATIFDLASAYCSGVIRNHPFVDGNKRAGVLAAAMFLDFAGYHFTPDEAEAYVVVMAVAEGKLDDATLAAWIAENVTPKSNC